MRNNVFFLAVVLLITSCGNAQKKKVSDKITGVFSYTKNGTPAFKIKDTIINGKKKYTIYDYQTKKKLIGNIDYDEKIKGDITSKRSKDIKRLLNEAFKNWEEWLHEEIKISLKTGHHKKEYINFKKVKKGIILEEKFTEGYKMWVDLFKKEGIKIIGYDKKITTGFLVLKSKVEYGIKKYDELKVLHKLSDL